MGKIVRYVIDLDNPPPLTDEQKSRLKALAEMPDSEIDYSDIPPLDEAFWQRAERNPFLRKRSMSETNKQLELEAFAAVGEMLLFDQARGNPEEAARILRCARLFARSEDAAQRLNELCTAAGSDATWHESIVEELQDREDLQAAETVMQRIHEGGEGTTPAADVRALLEAGYAAQAQAEQEPFRYEIMPRPAALGGGWRLRLLERGEEVGGGVFPLSEYATAENAEEAANYAYEDALAEASAWLASRQEPQPKPKRCEKDGPYWLSKCDRPKWVTVCGEGSNWGIQKCESCGGSWEFGDLE